MKSQPLLHEALLTKIFSEAPASGTDGGVDVEAWLDGLAQGKAGIDWRISIVDLLTLLDLDTSHAARRRMAKDLGCPKEDIDSRGSAELNLWLLKQVFAKINERGGRLTATLPV